MMPGEIWLTEPMIPEVCAKTGYHRTTVARWVKDQKFPKNIHILLDIITNGNLGHIHPLWDGYRIDVRDGELITPEVKRARNIRVKAREIYLTTIRYQQISALTIDKRELEARCESQERKIAELEKKVSELQKAQEYLDNISEPNVVAWRNRNLK